MRRSRIASSAVGAAALVALIALPALMPAAAGAETTHKFLKNISLPVNGARLMGVDPQGNIILLAEGAVRKFSPTGEPVNFSALGTNVIDGAGGGNCRRRPPTATRPRGTPSARRRSPP